MWFWPLCNVGAQKPIEAHHQSAAAFQKENLASKFIHQVLFSVFRVPATGLGSWDISHEENKDHSLDGVCMEVGGADNAQLKKLRSTFKSGNNYKTEIERNQEGDGRKIVELKRVSR